MTVRPLVLAILLASGMAHGAEWKVDPAHSTLGFSGTAEGESFTGQFKQFTPTIHFDPANLADARFDVEIALASADSANAERDETLQGSDFFDTAKAPKAQYTATTFRDLGGGKFVAEGTLSLRGAQKAVPLEFTWSPNGEGATLTGTATVNRLDFGIGAGDWADESTITHAIGVTTTLHLSPQ